MSQTSSRARIIVVVCVIIILALGAGLFSVITTPPTVSTTPTTPETSQSVTLAFAGPPDVTDTPGFMIWQVFARNLGITMNVQYYDGDPAAARALLTGTTQIAQLETYDLILANGRLGNASGSYPLVMFSQYEASQDFALVVSNSIKSWSDLAGQSIGTFGPGSSSFVLCTNFLTQHNIPASQQNCVAAGPPDVRARELIQGTLTGALIEPFGIVTAVESGCCHILENVPTQFPKLIGTSFVTTRDFSTKHHDVVLKLSEATLLAARWAHNETQWMQKEQIEFPGTNVTQAGAAWRLWMAMNIWNPNGVLSYDAITYNENYYISNHKYIKEFFDPKYFLDLSYQTEALATIGQYAGPLLGYPDPTIPELNIVIPGAFPAGNYILSMSVPALLPTIDEAWGRS